MLVYFQDKTFTLESLNYIKDFRFITNNKVVVDIYSYQTTLTVFIQFKQARV